MPKSGKEVVAILEKLGWNVKSQKGSHVKLQRGSIIVIVPVHGNRDLGRGLIRALERQTGEKFS